MQFKKIIISRTDGIGDVVLALPVAGVIKELYPACDVIFLGRSYTEPVINLCEHIDRFIAWGPLEKMDEHKAIVSLKQLEADIILHVFPRKKIAMFARKAKIPQRIGTSSRLYHWWNCNNLIKLSRKNSVFHEAQLNLKLLHWLGAKEIFSLEEIPRYYGLKHIPPLADDTLALLSKTKFNLIIHPCSKGNAREWGMDNFKSLIALLPKDKFKIFITGTEEEGAKFRPFLINKFPEVVDISGKLSLGKLIRFINQADGLLAASTGPLHIAAALGKHTLGLYAPMRPINPVRWAPIGVKASFIVKEKSCSKCRKLNRCECIESITPEEVKEKLMTFAK